MSEIPDWVTPGAAVVELRGNNHGHDGTGTVVATTIDRILKRDIVLGNGHRYRRAEQPCRTGVTAWDPSTFLLSSDDPRVAKMRVANRRFNRKGKIDTAMLLWKATPDVGNTDDLSGLLGDWKEEL